MDFTSIMPVLANEMAKIYQIYLLIKIFYTANKMYDSIYFNIKGTFQMKHNYNIYCKETLCVSFDSNQSYKYS